MSTPRNMFTYTNRRGDTYYLHGGKTKLGNPKYFASKKSAGALNTVPDGFEVCEDINGIVIVRRPSPSAIPDEDFECVQTKVRSHRHLKNYRVITKERSIIIYEPLGLDAIKISNPDSFSARGALEPLIRSSGRTWDDFVEEMASQSNISVEEFNKLQKAAAVERHKEYVDSLKRNMQYRPVMRFLREKRDEIYVAERMSYRGSDEQWLSLGIGAIEDLSKRYVRHIGKDSFFDLCEEPEPADLS